MDPIQALLAYLQELLPRVDTAIEERVRDIFSRFELVPKHEYENHVDLLQSLKAEVESLEARVRDLEAGDS